MSLPRAPPVRRARGALSPARPLGQRRGARGGIPQVAPVPTLEAAAASLLRSVSHGQSLRARGEQRGGEVLIHGACHCGNVRFELAWPPSVEQISARACGCSFCMKHGGVWTSHKSGVLRLEVRDPERLSTYNFGTRTADFHVCSA